MSEYEPARPNANETISRHAYSFVAIWAVIVFLFYCLVGIIGTHKLQRYKANMQQRRHAWLSTKAMDTGVPMAAPSPASTPVAVRVLVNHVGDFSLREGRWDIDFDVSFRWKGDMVNPGATFQVLNAEILQRKQEVSRIVGDERFERYNVRARMEQAFDPTRFPFSGTGLIVEIEDASHDLQELHYTVNQNGIHLAPLAFSQGLKVKRTYSGIKLYSYGTGSGAGDEVHSRFVFAMFVEPRGIEIYMKMFQALFASVAVSLVVFFIKPTFVDPRFGLGIGAFFAAIGNNIFLVTLLPPANRVTLTDMVNLVGLVTIFLTLVQSTISLHFCDTARWRLSRFFDRMCFPLFIIGYLTVNLLLPYVAKS